MISVLTSTNFIYSKFSKTWMALKQITIAVSHIEGASQWVTSMQFGLVEKELPVLKCSAMFVYELSPAG